MIGGRHKVGVKTSLAAASVLALLVSSAAFAADASASDSGYAAQGAAIEGAAPPQALAATGAARDTGLPFEGWMLYPSLFVGGSYNDNLYLTPTNRKAGFGVRIAPNIEADYDAGIWKTTVYANADAQLYPGYNPKVNQSASMVSARAGIAEMWSPTSDVVAHFLLDYTRAFGPFGSVLATASPIGSATSFVGAPTGVNANPYRQFYNQTTVILSVQKNVTDDAFVRVGARGQSLIYERPPTGVVSALNGAYVNPYLRLGFRVTPILTAFVEGDGDFYRYYTSPFFDTNGYRVVGGLSSDLIRLMRGEIYAGFAQQFAANSGFGSASAPVYGGSLTYYPTQYFTLAASLDESFSPAAVGPGSTVLANNRTLQARLQADYAMFQYWRASVRGGYIETRYEGSPLLTQAWLAGGGVSYNFWTNIAVTMDYQYTRSISNGFGALSYADNLVSLGLTYAY